MLTDSYIGVRADRYKTMTGRRAYYIKRKNIDIRQNVAYGNDFGEHVCTALYS